MRGNAFEVVLAGGGPSATLLAAACAKRGLSVALIAPGGLRPSPHTLCAFASELPTSLTASTWSNCQVRTTSTTHALPAYARFDAVAAADAARAVASVFDGSVVAVDHDGALCADGRRVAGHVVDCTGLAGKLVTRAGKALAFQTAFGLRIRGRDPQLPPGTAAFMDWSADNAADDDDGPPSFLYALVDDDGTLLLEETALGARPAVSLTVLRARLQRRLSERRVQVDAVLGEEAVVIPLDVALPHRDQRVGAFGLAAGLVHPTSGFHVATALRLAGAVADALALHAGSDAVDAANAVADACFSPERRAQREMHLFALEAALGLRSAQEAGAFFDAFFAVPESAAAWLAGRSTTTALQRSMLGMFGRADWAVRARLLGVLPALPALVRGMWASKHHRPFSSSSAPAEEPSKLFITRESHVTRGRA